MLTNIQGYVYMSSPAPIDQFGQISLVVQDLERATHFYKETLGLDLLFSMGGMSFFDVGGVRLMLGNAGGEYEHGSSILYYRVADIDAWHQRMLTAGVKVLEEPQEVHKQETSALWLAFYSDSEGNAFSLMEDRS